MTDEKFISYTVYMIEFMSNITIDSPSSTSNIYNNTITFYDKNNYNIDDMYTMSAYKSYDISSQFYGYVYSCDISSVELFEQYMIILTNRIIKYKNHIIQVSKSISTGLSSSLLVFTYILEEIFLRWLDENIGTFQINIDFILNIYVDDIYIKILNFEKKDIIINSIIEILSKYNFNISYKKSRISRNLLNNNFKELSPNDLYLGIPFTRDKTLYMPIILNECNKNYNSNYTWNQIFEILNNEIIKNNKKKRKLNSYLNYKLKPILNNMNVKDFIEDFLNNI
jgi:hypothetical protein